jgi:hypothetical protein
MSASVSRTSPASFPRSLASAARGLALAAAATLAVPSSAQVVVLTVGPHGSSSTIQGALAGVVSGWVNDVRIESGTYVENVVVESPTVSFTGGELHFSGGWNSTFTGQTSNPSLTTIDGNFNGSCMKLHPSLSAAATITVSNLTVTHGLAENGGGISIESSTTSSTFRLTNVSFTQNVAQGLGSAWIQGGGLDASLSGDQSHLRVRNCGFIGNSAQTFSDNGAEGGGAYIEMFGTGISAGIEFATFENNTSSGNALVLGGGLHLYGRGQSTAWVIGSEFTANEVFAASSQYSAGAGLFASFSGGSLLMLREISLLSNSCSAVDGSQADIFVYETTAVAAGDILAAGGDNGVYVNASDSAEVNLTNVTATDNAGVGFRFIVGAPTVAAVLQNTLLYGNGTNLQVSGSVTGDHNLIGIDPHFANPTGGDYHLTAGSPAENAGTNSPAPGLGDTDCSGSIRLIDGVVDIGALEGVDLIFSDGVAWGHTGRWSATVGATD